MTPSVAVGEQGPSMVASTFCHFARDEGQRLPLPGSGQTWDRFETLMSFAAIDLSLGRLVEGHADALAILSEAGMREHIGASYGVWAARSRADDVTAAPVTGGWRLSGSKAFCSGSGTVDRALVTATAPDGQRLFDVSVPTHVTHRDNGSWPAVGMADSDSETVHFGGPVIDRSHAVGGPGFYTGRPGFWFGAVGVAACWCGGAAGLVDHLIDSLDPSCPEHVLTDLGRAVSRVETMRQVLGHVATRIDVDPDDRDGQARFCALAARQIVHDCALEVLAATAAAGGARPLCHDRAQGRRAADLFVYLAQHHGAMDAAELGRMALGADR